MMLKKIFLTISALSISCVIFILPQTSFAETCPSVSDIKNNTAHDWKVYDSEDGTRLTASREKKFKKIVEEFALAEWTNHSKQQMGSIHCYYRDKSGSSLEAYLAKDHFNPKLGNKSFWYQVSGYMHCAAGKERCEFVNHLLPKQQLAMKDRGNKKV